MTKIISFETTVSTTTSNGTVTHPETISVDLDSATAEEIANALNLHPSEEVSARLVLALNDAVKAENAVLKRQKIQEIINHEEKADIWAAISECRLSFTGFKYTVGKESQEYERHATTRKLSFYDLEKAYQILHSTKKDDKGRPVPNTSVTLAQRVRYEGILCAFRHNVILAKRDAVSSKDRTMTVKDLEGKTLSVTVDELAARKGVDECIVDLTKTNKDALIEQANAIAAILFPAEMPAILYGSDVTMVKDALMRCDRAEYSVQALSTVLDEIIINVIDRNAKRAIALKVKGEKN